MRIVCPSCEAEYELPDNLLAAGPRKVRCARCNREWQAAPPPGMSTAPMPPPPAPLPPLPPPSIAPDVMEEARQASPQPPAPPSEPKAKGPPPLAEFVAPLVPDGRKPRDMPVPGGPPRVGLVIAWLLTVAVLAGGVGAAWLKKAEIVAAWPPAARIYKLLDLD